jgi:hypothetical protein
MFSAHFLLRYFTVNIDSAFHINQIVHILGIMWFALTNNFNVH